MRLSSPQSEQLGGFTLVEVSIVLVIIGLIVGGILVGRDLINAAKIHAQISQIQKYQAAVNTFRVKYNGLPGDLLGNTAAAFGFAARNSSPGYGDGNAVIEGQNSVGAWYTSQECTLFWNDLSKAGLIDGGFSADDGNANGSIGYGGTLPMSAILPQAKISGGNYVFVWSGGYGIDFGDGGDGASTLPNNPNCTGNTCGPSNGINYFGLSVVNGTLNGFGIGRGAPGLTVAQAYAMDTKVDDGMPQSGRIIAMYPNGYSDVGLLWAQNVTFNDTFYLSAPVDGSTATPGPKQGVTTTCYDNDNTDGVSQQYSVANPDAINCALSFQFQ